MERVAEEWRRQGETIDPPDMPLTRLLNVAIDGVAGKMDETRAATAAYADSDLVCYRADEPESLAERQRQAFDPVLDWAEEKLGVRFNLAAGVMHVRQPPEALAAVRAALDAVEDPTALAALSTMTALTGSVLLALAVADGRITRRGGLARRACGRGFPGRALGRGRRGEGAPRGALAGDGGGCGGGGGVDWRDLAVRLKGSLAFIQTSQATPVPAPRAPCYAERSACSHEAGSPA